MLRIGGVESMREVLSYALKHHAIRVVHSLNAEARPFLFHENYTIHALFSNRAQVYSWMFFYGKY